jgi:TRAP-type C4-dicarboxylate transport system permease small subunit
MDRILDKILAILAVLSGLLLLFITFAIFYTIVARFLDIPGPIWAVQFTEYALLWMTLLGTAWVLKQRRHVSVDLLTSRLSAQTKLYFNLAHSVMGVVVSGVLCWYGTVVTWGQYQRGVMDIQVVDMPKYLILIIIPIGFLFLIGQFFRKFLTDLKRVKDLPGPISTGVDSPGRNGPEVHEKNSEGGET